MTNPTGTATKATNGGSVFLAPDPAAAASLMKSLLANPRELSNIIAARAENTIAVNIFGGQGRLNSGTTFHTKIDPEDLAAEGVKKRTEGSEYAMVRIVPPDIERVDTTDIGGKFRITDEAQEAGTIDLLNDGIALVSNSIVDVLDDMVFAALREATETTGEFFRGNAWANIQLTGSTPTAPRETAAADLINAQARLATNGLRAVGDLLVLNPLDEAALKIAYGDGYGALLDGLGITTAPSPKAPLGDAYLIDTKGLGGVTSKKGLVTETWRDSSIRSTWVQTYLEPAVFISRPNNIVRISDIARTDA